MIIGDPKKHAAGILAGIRLDPKTGAMADNQEPEAEGKDDGMEGMQAIAEEMINAMHARDAMALAKCMKDMFDLMESMPHDEAEQEESSEQPPQE